MTMKLTGISGTGDDSDGPSDVSIAGSGVVDLERQELAMEFSEDSRDLNDSNGSALAFDLRIVHGILYYESDGDWIMTPVDTADAGTPDPEGYLSYLEGVSGDVRVEGHEVLRGASTTRYGATINLDRALAHASSAGQRADLAHALDLFGNIDMPATVWLDDVGRLRKIDLSINLASVATRMQIDPAAHPKIDESLELYDFGVSVAVVAPAHARSAATVAQDRAAQSDLRNGLTAEKTVFTDNETYDPNPATMRQIEPSLDWGGKLTVVVGPANGMDRETVCLAERSKSGTNFALLDVAMGSGAGTYYGTSGCPATVDETSALGWSTTGWK